MGLTLQNTLRDAYVTANNPPVRSTGAPDPCRGHGDDRHHVAQAPRPATTLSRFLDSARKLKMSLMAEISNIPIFGIFDKCEFSLQHREFVRPLRF